MLTNAPAPGGSASGPTGSALTVPKKAMVNGFLDMVALGPKNTTVTKKMLMHNLTINIEGSVLHEVFITNLLHVLLAKHLGPMISGQLKTNVMPWPSMVSLL
ncbi:hypothetical protein BC828DRAFT_401184 [Blastocladiella britannica]|nr:hypothetical protein BC828DRAFT_401184 [Blastocladiella britannica]